MDAQHVLASVQGKNIKIPLGVYRPILDPHGLEKWNKLEVQFAQVLKEKLLRSEISESDIDAELVKWSCEQIKAMEINKKKMKDLEFMESKLNLIDEEIRSSMNEDKIKCMWLLIELEKLDLNPLVLKKNPSIVETILMLSEQYYSLPRITTRSKMTEFRESSEELKQQVHNIIRKFSIVLNAPDNTPFFDFFNEEIELFNRQIKNLTSANLNDLLLSSI